MSFRPFNTRTKYQDDFTQESEPEPVPGEDGEPVVDEILDIASDLRTGTDGQLVTGTPGAAGRIAAWDANGDLIDAGVTASGLHTQNTDTGTTATSFAVNSGGTGFRLKNNAGQAQVRNLNDSADGDLKARHLTLTGTVTGLELAADLGVTFDEHASAPSTPASGKVVVYAKADGKIYRKDDTGTEEELGGAVTQFENSKSEEINQLIMTGMQKMMSQLQELPLENGSADGILQKIQSLFTTSG